MAKPNGIATILYCTILQGAGKLFRNCSTHLFSLILQFLNNKLGISLGTLSVDVFIFLFKCYSRDISENILLVTGR